MSINKSLILSLNSSFLGKDKFPWEYDLDIFSGSGSTQSLDLSTGGTFTRSTEASYLIGAPTDGSTAFLAWAPTNTRRIENRGDGLGNMLLMEGARTNYVFNSRDITSGWISGSSTTVTVDSYTGPDGLTLADHQNVVSANYGNYKIATTATSTTHFASSWIRATGSATYVQYHVGSSDGQDGMSGTVNTTYQRFTASHTTTTHSAVSLIPWEGRASVITGWINSNMNHVGDLHQLEIGFFPSSPIRTTTAAGTRALDALDYAVGQYPSSFLDRGFTMTIAPDCSSDEFTAAGNQMALIGIPAQGCLIRLAGSGSIQWYINTPYQGATGNLTWSRGQLMTISFVPSTSTLTVVGATTGNGTFTSGSGATWNSGTLRIGNGTGYTAPFFGRIGTKIIGL